MADDDTEDDEFRHMETNVSDGLFSTFPERDLCLAVVYEIHVKISLRSPSMCLAYILHFRRKVTSPCTLTLI